jgi:hypothetical protein
MRRLRGAFRALFGPNELGLFTPEQQIALAELRRFCHADTSCFDADPRVHAHREGRREVWLRVQAFLQLTDLQIAGIKEIDDDSDE